MMKQNYTNKITKYRIVFYLCVLTSVAISPFEILISEKSNDRVSDIISTILMGTMIVLFIIASIFLFKILKLEKRKKEAEEEIDL